MLLKRARNRQYESLWRRGWLVLIVAFLLSGSYIVDGCFGMKVEYKLRSRDSKVGSVALLEGHTLLHRIKVHCRTRSGAYRELLTCSKLSASRIQLRQSSTYYRLPVQCQLKPRRSPLPVLITIAEIHSTPQPSADSSLSTYPRPAQPSMPPPWQ